MSFSIATPASVVYQVVDNRTSLVVKQYPDQGVLRRRAYSRALEQAREDAHALRIDGRFEKRHTINGRPRAGGDP